MNQALRAGALAISLIALGACAEADRLGPADEASLTGTAEPTAAAVPAGIMLGSFGMTPAQLNSVHTGIVRGTTPSSLLSYLQAVKAKGGRVLVVLVGGQQPRNADNTFSLTKWKSAVDKYRSVNFSSYVADGTIAGHFVIDEPHFPSRWGNHVIPQATVEEAAKYSKQLWPNMATVVNAPLSWLVQSSVTYTHLDAGWAMFRAGTHSSPSTWAASQVSKAKQKGLGLFAGLNVLDGGNGSSGFRGNLPSKWAMSAAELRSYGGALLAQSYVCGFAMWEYDATYYGRADVKSAMSELSTKAKSHAKTSCRQ